ncbi:MAG: hypothetical protein KI785_13025 [Devosiaceae bacterium]|nr:hypothetical protein [Devosiaceae bacterium MH13]
MLTIAAIAYCVLLIAPTLCQMALAAGAPWGELTLGGRYPGRLPQALRLACSVQAMLLMTMGLAVADYAGLIALGWPTFVFWIAFGLTVLTAIGNTITPSKLERMAWAPVTIGMLIAITIVSFTR